MDPDDIVDLDSVARVRAITKREARIVVLLSPFVGILAGIVCAGLVLWIKGPQETVGAAIAFVAFSLIGVGHAIHWLRHYRCIFRQLDVVERSVARGEQIYGSQVKFYSYK